MLKMEKEEYLKKNGAVKDPFWHYSKGLAESNERLMEILRQRNNLEDAFLALKQKYEGRAIFEDTAKAD